MLSNLPPENNYFRSFSYIRSQVRLNSQICCIGRSSIRESVYDWHGLRRGNRELILWQYTLEGMGRLEYEGKQLDLLPGEAMLLNIPHNHRYYFPKGSPNWEFVYIVFGGIELFRICQELVTFHGPIIKYHGAESSLECAGRIMAEGTKTDYDIHRLSALSYEFAMALLKDSEEKLILNETFPLSIRKALDFAVNHFEEPIGVEDMCQVSGISRFHFSRVFKKCLKQSPGEFIRRLRLEKAVRMLQTEQVTVSKIADRCGFQSANYFTRAFQHEFGISPNQFRNNQSQLGEKP